MPRTRPPRRTRNPSGAVLAAIMTMLIGTAASQPFQREQAMDDKTVLANLVEPVNPNQAELIRRPATKVLRLPVPFLQRGLIFRFDWDGPYRTISGTIGFARPGNTIHFLAAQPAEFDALVAQAGLVIDTEQQRLDYALTRLEVTRRFDQTFTVLRSFDQLRLMTDPTPEVAERFKTIQKAYAAKIKPPVVERVGAGWVVPVYVMVGDDLCLYTVTIAADGRSAHSRTVLEAHTLMLLK